MSTRNAILQSIRKGRGPVQESSNYMFPLRTNDLASLFIETETTSIARFTEICAPEEALTSIWAILSEWDIAKRIHIPADSGLRELPWHRAPGLTLSPSPPSGEDTALSAADHGIAETGTLAFFSG